MKIPAKLQVFDTPVLFDTKDEERLSPYLASWMHLSALLKDINEPDLMRLVILELMDRQRAKILDRLLMRLGKVQRQKIKKRIAKIL